MSAARAATGLRWRRRPVWTRGVDDRASPLRGPAGCGGRVNRFAFGAGEWRGGLQATAAMLPFTLSYGFIAFGMLGAAATQAGLAASVFSVVVGGVLLALLSRA
ncbi:MAG: hypothetical protein ACK52I_36920, partial [Pseudomonadota bacterium]